MDHCSMSFYHNNVRDKYFNMIKYILYTFFTEMQMTYFKNKEHIIAISYNSPHMPLPRQKHLHDNNTKNSKHICIM